MRALGTGSTSLNSYYVYWTPESVELGTFEQQKGLLVFMSDNQFFSGVFALLSPHLWVIAGIIIAALWNLFFPRLKHVTPLVSLSTLAMAVVIYLKQFGADRQDLFARLYVVDTLSVALGLISCLVGIVVIFMSMGYERKFAPHRGEYYAILLTAIVSVMFLAGTTDLIMLFVSLETLTICCVLLSGFAKRDIKSNEASLKYLLSTAATTATFLYGLSFLYGLTGSTNYYDIQAKIFQVSQSPSLVAILLLVLLISAVGFKLSMAPFHMWTPDVYEGAPTPVTAFLSVGSKLGGIAVALRLLPFTFASASADWVPIIGGLAILSMIVGNLIALCQRSVKRMLAYSSIAHVGYFLIALAANNGQSLAALLFYVIIYGFMNLGAFACAIMIENELATDDMEDWSGLIRKRPWLTIAMTICLLNLGGLPIPPAGFFAKFFVFWSGIQMYSNLGNWLVIAGLVTSIPAVFYYTRVAIKMIVREPSSKVAALPAHRIPLVDSQLGPVLAVTICLVGLVAGSTVVGQLMDFSGKAVSALMSNAVVGSAPNPSNRIN